METYDYDFEIGNEWSVSATLKYLKMSWHDSPGHTESNLNWKTKVQFQLKSTSLNKRVIDGVTLKACSLKLSLEACISKESNWTIQIFRIQQVAASAILVILIKLTAEAKMLVIAFAISSVANKQSYT